MTPFHPVRFASTDEAAAFIAALYGLNSPERVGDPPRLPDRSRSGSIAVQLRARSSICRMRRSTRRSRPFRRCRFRRLCRNHLLPARCRQVIGGGQHPSWGIAEVQRLLASLALCFIAILAAPVATALAQTDVTLSALTVPDAKLPAGCRLQPPAPPPTRVARGDTVFVSGNPAPFFPFPTNPWVGVVTAASSSKHASASTRSASRTGRRQHQPSGREWSARGSRAFARDTTPCTLRLTR